MRNGRAERPRRRPLRVDMDPLAITCRLGEQVDLALGDLVPLARAEVLVPTAPRSSSRLSKTVGSMARS